MIKKPVGYSRTARRTRQRRPAASSLRQLRADLGGPCWTVETFRIAVNGRWRTLPVGARWNRARKLRQAYGRKKGHR